MAIPEFSPDVDWPTLGRRYRTGMFLGTLFELMATGYVLAIMSRYFTLVKKRRASSTEQIAVSVACLIAVTQMCIHFQSVYQNGIENYMQVMRLALDDVWQMHSVWALSGVVWAISNGVLVWHWRMVSDRGAPLAALLVPVIPAASGLTVTIMRAIFHVNPTVTVTGVVTLPSGFNSVKPVLYMHYSLLVAAQLALSALAFPRAHTRHINHGSRWQCLATMCHYYKQLMITPLIAALITLLCFVIQPGWNLDLIALLPLSAASLANVVAILNAHALAGQGKDSPTSSQSDSLKYLSTSKNRVVIPVERTEVVAISDKDAAYSPARIGLNRLPFSSSKSTLSSDPSMKEKVQGGELY